MKELIKAVIKAFDVDPDDIDFPQILKPAGFSGTSISRTKPLNKNDAFVAKEVAIQCTHCIELRGANSLPLRLFELFNISGEPFKGGKGRFEGVPVAKMGGK